MSNTFAQEGAECRSIRVAVAIDDAAGHVEEGNKHLADDGTHEVFVVLTWQRVITVIFTIDSFHSCKESINQGSQGRLFANLYQADTNEHHREVEMNFSQFSILNIGIFLTVFVPKQTPEDSEAVIFAMAI